MAKVKLIDDTRKKLRDSTLFESPSKPSNGYVLPPRVCVDFRYLKDKESQETSEELRNAKHQAANNVHRYSTIVGLQ